VDPVEKVFRFCKLKDNASVEEESAKNVEVYSHSVLVADGLSVDIALTKVERIKNGIIEIIVLQNA